MSETVTISVARLQELEAAAAAACTFKDQGLARIAKLREKDTQDKINNRVRKHYELHRDEINARRREKRRLARAAAAAAAPGVGTTVPV
jgi:hypothetical protein